MQMSFDVYRNPAWIFTPQTIVAEPRQTWKRVEAREQKIQTNTMEGGSSFSKKTPEAAAAGGRVCRVLEGLVQDD